MALGIGVTVGKFMPLHIGHEFMIEFGAMMLDELHVIVSGKETDVIPLSHRHRWLLEYARRTNIVSNTKIYIHCHVDESPVPVQVDEHGTVLDKEFQDYWVSEFKRLVPKATHFVSSDRYGKAIADLMNIEWLPVDPDREMIDCSATEIRRDPYRNFHLLSDIVKPYYVQKVAIIGPESTGKSTLTKKLAAGFGAVGIPEYGRTISEMKDNQLTADDFLNIYLGQKRMITHAAKHLGSPLIISDTEAITTAMFSEIYINHEAITHSLYQLAKSQEFALYILLAPTVDWIDDGTRVLGNQEDRRVFYERLLGFMKEYNKNYIVIDEPDFESRYKQAYDAIEQLINQNPIGG